MATTTAPPREQLGGMPRAREVAGRAASRPAWLLALALGAAVLYACFASGATGLQDESKLQVGIAAISLGTIGALLFGRGLGVAAERGTAMGIGLLVGFAVWCGLSIAWSVAPDESWVEFNRAIAYSACTGLAVVLGSSLPNAARRVGAGYLAIATAVALYALGGKVAPWASVPGVFDLNHTELISRLREPLGYWNALALVCVLAVPIALGAVAEVKDSPRRRLISLVALLPLLTVTGLTYSRGGLISVVVAVALLMLMRADSLRIVAFFIVAVVSAIPAVLSVVLNNTLTTDGLPVSDRVDDGLYVLAALIVGALFLLAAGWLLVRAGDAVKLGSRGRMLAPRVAVAVVAVGALLFVGSLATSERGLTGSISHSWHGFTAAKGERQNDPGRVLKTNSGNRWVWWNEAAGAWSDRPIVGHGAGSFPVLHKRYRHNKLEVRQPHSVPLEFLAETGLIGAMLALGGLGMLTLGAFRRFRRMLPAERAAAAPLLAGVVAWGVHIWVDWDWDIPAATIPVLIFLGVLVARPRPELPPAGHEGRSFGARALVLAAGAGLGALFVVSAVFPALADSWASEALTEASKGNRVDLDRAAKHAAAAKRLNPFSVEPVFASAIVARRRGQDALVGKLYAEAIDRQPDNPTTWARVAEFQLLAGDAPGALRSIDALFKLDPLAITTAIYASATGAGAAESATAAGTPLPEGPLTPTPKPPVPKPKPQPKSKSEPKPATPSTPTPTPAPRTPAPQAAPQTPKPAPTPTPSPTPQPPSTPAPDNNDGTPFSLN